jgi:protein SCO1/2
VLTPIAPLELRIRRVVCLACLAALTFASCTGDAPPRPDELRGSVLPEPLPKADFTLTTTEGEPFDFRAETEGYVTLLFFGYTYCPDICPVHMASIAAVLHKLPPQTANRIKVVMVSVDPERDTPERFRSWLDNFDRSFIGVTGTPEQLATIQQAFYLPVAVKQGEGPDYSVGHSTAVIAFTTDNLARVRYPSGTRQSDWAHDLPLLVEAEWERP